MSFPYKKVLVIGATSGIGEALASKIISAGSQVVVVGRRKERLDAFVSQRGGASKASSAVFDISELSSIPEFASSITTEHPDIDSVFLNSGVQHVFDFSKPETVDLDKLENEFRVNYVAYIHLVKAFLPHLQQKKVASAQTSIIFTSSGLALIPATHCPNYSATKAALHHFVLALREQLKKGPGNVKIVEIFPPAVQTELHDYMPDGRKFGMPLQEFLDETWAGLTAGEDQIPVGFVKGAWERFEAERQGAFKEMNERRGK